VALQPNLKVKITQQAVSDCSGFVQLNQPTSSRDLTNGNYYLFLNLKNFLRGVHYPNNNRLKSVVEV